MRSTVFLAISFAIDALLEAADEASFGALSASLNFDRTVETDFDLVASMLALFAFARASGSF
jgi:hypothetical protein